MGYELKPGVTGNISSGGEYDNLDSIDSVNYSNLAAESAAAAANSATTAANASRLTVGTTTTIDPGLPAVVTITGPAGAQLLNVSIPRGQDGSGGDMYKAENLSGLANYATARSNLGLGTAATTNSTAYATAAQGATADTAIQSLTSTDGSVSFTTTGTSRNLTVNTAGSTRTVTAQVRNTTGTTLTKGTAVYISGATGQISTVSRALANADSTSAQTLGLVSNDLANNTNGEVTIIGLITNINTSAYTDGQQLYLSPTTPGALTATKPFAPSHIVYMAVVEHAHSTQGKLFVKVQNGYELDEIHDVSAQSPVNGQTIVYNSTTNLWEKNTVSLTAGVNGTLPLANGGTNATTAQGAINSLAGAVTSGSYLRGNGTNVVMSAIQAADVPTLNQNTTGNAATATVLQTARTIGGVSFNGSANINLPGVNTAGNQNTTGTAANVTGIVAIANGGTGASTRQDAMDALAGAVTAGQYLRGNGTDVIMSAIQASDVPTLNQNTTGTATNVTGTVAIANGGTGETTRQAAMDALAGAVTSGQYLRGNGTDVVMSAIQAADVPTLNQNTTGTAANVTGIVAVANGGTGTSTPALIAGTNVTITGTWPNQTISSTGGGGSPFTTPVVINVNSTDPALKLTQTGTGPALLAEDSASPDATPTVIDQFGNLILGKDSRSRSVNNKVEIHSTSESFVNPSIGLYNTSTTSTDESNISFRHDKGGLNDPGDHIGRINFLTVSGGGSISAKADVFLSGVDMFYAAQSHQFTGPITSSRINPRVSSTTSIATLIPDISAADQYNLTAQAVNLTIGAPVGTPVDGNKLIIRILDNGTPRTITWNSTYTPIGMTLPTNTTTNKIMYVGCIYNSANNRWDVIALTVQT